MLHLKRTNNDRYARILILGDSHVSFFDKIENDFLNIQVCKRQGATAYGVNNPESETKSNEYFLNFLNNTPSEDMNSPHIKYFADIESQPPDYVCFFLGEIDCRSLTWKLKYHRQQDWKDTLKISAENLFTFAEKHIFNKIVPSSNVVFLHPHLCKSADPWVLEKCPEALVKQSEYTFYFNNLLDSITETKSIGITREIYDVEIETAKSKYIESVESRPDYIDTIHLNGINENDNPISRIWQSKLEKFIK